LLQELWASILEVRAAMLWAATLPEVCQGVHATAQAASVYMRLLEAAEYGPRLAALEKAVEEMQHAELHRGPLGQAHNGRH
jgi:hypothetical protein